MTQEPAWLAFQPIGDRPWWGVNGAPPFVEVDDAIHSPLHEGPSAGGLPGERVLSDVPAEAWA